MPMDMAAYNLRARWRKTRQRMVCVGRDPDPAIADNVATYLLTPTADGSNNGMHPSVLDFGAGGWNGSRYWMSCTPYPNQSSSVENPHILCSANGTDWNPPAGLTNPLIGVPAGSARNSDSDLVLAPNGTTVYCVYREYLDQGSQSGFYETLYYFSSTNGSAWSGPSLLNLSVTSATLSLLSPTILWDGTQYVCWVINKESGTGLVHRYTASAITGPWTGPTVCSVTASVGTVTTDLWHVEVRRLASGVYAMAVVDNLASKLYFATSDDGIAWQIGRAPCLSGRAGQWDNGLYRSSFVEIAGANRLDLYYTGSTAGGAAWYTGRTTLRL